MAGELGFSCIQLPSKVLYASMGIDRGGLTRELADHLRAVLDEAGVSLALAQMGLSAKSIEPVGSAKHIFTHIEWDMKGYFADVTGETDDLFWTDAAAFDAAAIPTAFKKFAALVRARLQ